MVKLLSVIRGRFLLLNPTRKAPVPCKPSKLKINLERANNVVISIRFVVPVNETILIHANTSSVGSGQTPPVSGVLHASITDDAEQVDAVVTITKDSETSEVELVNVCLMRTEVGWGIAIYVRICLRLINSPTDSTSFA